MPTATVTYTFVDNTDAEASEVNQNFTDLLNFLNVTKLGSDNLQANSVTASQIAADAVGTSEIAANAVGTSELADASVDAAALAAAVANSLGITTSGSADLRGTETIATEESTTSITYAALATAGPTVQLDIPSHGSTGLLFAFIRVDMKSGFGSTASVDLQEAGVSLTGGGGLLEEAGDTYETRTAIPGSATGITTNRGGFVVMPAPAAGTYNYRLVYKTSDVDVACTFKNRRLSMVFMQF